MSGTGKLEIKHDHDIFAGVAVGGGWQALVAYINLICYYAIGLPLGFLLGYKVKFGVKVKNITFTCVNPTGTFTVALDFSLFFSFSDAVGNLDWHDLRDILTDTDPSVHHL